MPSDDRRRTAQQIELTVGRLESLSSLPAVASKVLDRVIRQAPSVASLAPIVECDPAMAARVLALGAAGGVGVAAGRFSLRGVMDRLGAETLADGLLAVRVFNPFGMDAKPAEQAARYRTDMLLHSLAVACCARDLAGMVVPEVNAELAWAAGLLHDVGKIALEEVMPKSFAKVVDLAMGRRLPSCVVEREQVGIDHAVLGRRLANKWGFPLEVLLAIWLHHSDTEAVAQILPAAQTARIVQLADAIALRSGIGASGSGGGADPVALAQGLDIDPNRLQPVYHRLAGAVRAKADLLGVDSPNAAAQYGAAAHEAIVRLSGARRQLSRDSEALNAATGRAAFLADFIRSVGAADTPLDIAERLAVRWQKAYQTAAVCVYLAPQDLSDAVEVLLVEALGAARPMLVERPGGDVVPNVGSRLALPNAHGRVDWLFEQLDVEFNPHGTRLLPLVVGGRAVGAVVFELHYPDDAEAMGADMRASAAVAAAMLEMAMTRDRERRLAEHFMGLSPGAGSAGVAESPAPQQAGRADDERLLDAITELAAGAAHELNNPLAVISGRAQLLCRDEADPRRREMLEQIEANSREVAGIVEQLMAYAQPPAPRPGTTDVRQLIEEASQLAAQRLGIGGRGTNDEIRTTVAEAVETVWVDSGQVASALANIIGNAAESYVRGQGSGVGGQGASVEIGARLDAATGMVFVTVTDYGCGMDAPTVEKAAMPFFSSKAAGRRRGMGLAFARRLLQVNRCGMTIDSEPGMGTTVTVSMPAASSDERC